MKKPILYLTLLCLLGCTKDYGTFGKHFATGQKVKLHEITLPGSTQPFTVTSFQWDAYYQDYFYSTVDANGVPWTHIIGYQLNECKGCN